jgi:hypothetical protein
MRLVHDGDRHWSVRNGDEIVATYRTDDLRYSVSWKAYCFTDEAERRAWATHADDLSLGMILKSLVSELRERGVLASTDHGLSEGELGRVLIDEFIRFPEVVPAATPAPAVAP